MEQNTTLDLKIGEGTVTISTKEYVSLIDNSRKLSTTTEDARKKIDEYKMQLDEARLQIRKINETIDEKVQKKLEGTIEFRKALDYEKTLKTYFHEELGKYKKEIEQYKGQLEIHSRIPFFIRKFFNAI